MRRLLLASLGWMLAAVGPLAAQAPHGESGPGFFAPLPLEDGPAPNDDKALVLPALPGADDHHAPDHFASSCHDPRVWVSGEYLFWWIKNAPLPIPLATGNNDPANIGALNEAGTVVLFGAGSGRSNNYDPFSGGRITVGGWLDADRRFGLEGSGFMLEQRDIRFSAGSPGGPTAPVVSIPFNATEPFNGNPAGETAVNSGNSRNTVNASISSQLWGAEANGLVRLFRDDRFYIAALAGLRYLDLTEGLALNDTTFDVTRNGNVRVGDSFRTFNQFYGGQIGLRGGLTFGSFFLDATLKVAFGNNHEASSINGATTVTNGAFGFANGATSGGVFAQPTNIGHTSRDIFAVAPEAQLKLGYQLGQYVRPFVGYNFLYLSEALRPGNQLDRNINPTTNFPFFVPPGQLTGVAAPLPGVRGSDFWAQGFNFGVEIRY